MQVAGLQDGVILLHKVIHASDPTLLQLLAAQAAFHRFGIPASTTLSLSGRARKANKGNNGSFKWIY